MLSAADPAVLRLAQKAAKQLRGLRLVPPGAEEGRITHLVVGQQRRTLKVLLAIAAGAFLLQPEWLAASLQAGAWLPEQPFWAKVLKGLWPPSPISSCRLPAWLPKVPRVVSRVCCRIVLLAANKNSRSVPKPGASLVC